MSRVFIFEPTKHDTSKLRQYGGILPLFDNEVRRPLRDQMLECDILSQLDTFEFDEKKDYVAMVGTQLSLAIFVSTLVAAYGNIRTLCFDATTSEYYERSMGHA